MKTTVVLGAAELQQAAIALVSRRPSCQGKFVGGVILVADPKELRQDLQIRANVILFDTEKAAREFAQGPTPGVEHGDKPATPADPAASLEDQAEKLHG
jgi:hypothetical protein